MVTAVLRPILRFFSRGGGLLCDDFSSSRCSNPCIFLHCHVRCMGIHITCPDPEGPCAAGGDCAPIAGPHLTGFDTKAHIPECLLNLSRIIGGDPRVIWGDSRTFPPAVTTCSNPFHRSVKHSHSPGRRPSHVTFDTPMSTPIGIKGFA